MAALYFISYALMATAAVIVIGWAQLSRRKSEGTPVNLTILKAAAGIAMAMWSGAALTSIAYEDDASMIAGSVVGVLFISFFAWQMHQVTKKIAQDERQLKELATKDSLTNLWNRRVFHELLHSEVARSKRYKLPLSLLMISIDNLEDINDKYGFKIGDAILRELGKSLDQLTRIPDNVCRFRGEMLSLILPMTELDNAEFFANRLRTTIEETEFQVGDVEPISVTLTFGISSFSDVHDTDTKIVKSARTALEDAMQSGARNTVRVCPRAQAAFEAFKQSDDVEAVSPAGLAAQPA